MPINYAGNASYGQIQAGAVDYNELSDAVKDAMGTPGEGSVTIDSLSSEVFDLISGGAGGDVNIIDGHDETQGAKADAVWDGATAAPSQQSILKRISNSVANTLLGIGAVADAAWVSGNGSVIAVLKGIFASNATTAAQTTTTAAQTTTTATNTGTIATQTTTNTTVQGAVADAAYTTGSGTVVSILKGIFGHTATVSGAVTSTRMKVNLLREIMIGAPTITSGAQDSSVIDISGYITGGFLIPAAFTGTSVTYKVSHTTTGHVPLRDINGVLITTPVSVSQAYPFPAESAGFASLIITSSAAEGATRTINTIRKG